MTKLIISLCLVHHLNSVNNYSYYLKNECILMNNGIILRQKLYRIDSRMLISICGKEERKKNALLRLNKNTFFIAKCKKNCETSVGSKKNPLLFLLLFLHLYHLCSEPGIPKTATPTNSVVFL
jgi:hypothetical protein